MKVIKYLKKILFSLTVSKIMLMLIFKIIQKKTSKMYYYGNLDIINNISKNTLIIFPHFRGNEIRDVLMSENIRKKNESKFISNKCNSGQKMETCNDFLWVFSGENKLDKCFVYKKQCC